MYQTREREGLVVLLRYLSEMDGREKNSRFLSRVLRVYSQKIHGNMIGIYVGGLECLLRKNSFPYVYFLLLASPKSHPQKTAARSKTLVVSAEREAG